MFVAQKKFFRARCASLAARRSLRVARTRQLEVQPSCAFHLCVALGRRTRTRHRSGCSSRKKNFFVRAARRSLRVARCASLGPGNLKFNHRAHFIFASHSGVGLAPVTEADVRRAKKIFSCALRVARCASLAARRSDPAT
jgi:hypothetical protein